MIAERFPDLMKLPVGERLRLADELFNSVVALGRVLSDEEIESELKKSWDDYVSDPASAKSWAEVKSELLRQQHG